jgi:IS605 OrfB family transposase
MLGDWWLRLPVRSSPSRPPPAALGIDLGLRDIAVTSDGERLEAGRWTHGLADRLAMAQRRGHKRQAKHLYRKAARCRADALHKFSRKLVDQYQNIVVGDVSSLKLVKTRMAKAVLDCGWGMLKAQLQYKGEHAGRCVQVVSERNTSRTCSSRGSLSGPQEVNGLRVRSWVCSECGDSHDWMLTQPGDSAPWGGVPIRAREQSSPREGAAELTSRRGKVGWALVMTA